MNLLNQVVEDQRFLDAQCAISKFAVHKTKRQLTYSNLQNLLARFRTNLKADAILSSGVKRSLFWRYLRDENLLQLLLCYEDCDQAQAIPPGIKLLSYLRHIGLTYLTPGKPYFVGDEGAESVTQLDQDIAGFINAGIVSKIPNSLKMVMAYLLDRLNDHVGNFIDGPYGYALASFENYALKPRVMRDFERLRLLGEGGFGKVHAVRVVDTNAVWALKEMNKVRIITKKRLNTVVAEATILRKVDYPFVARVHQVFQDDVNIYFLLDILPGGELKFHLRRMPVVPHEVAQFWMACLVLGIGYLHSKHIIHRDLKPSNCLLDTSGYVVISDFGLSVTAESAQDLRHDQCCGTPGYIAPEMYLGPCWDRRRPTEVKKRSSTTRRTTWLSTFQSSLRALTSKSARVDAFDPSNAQLARGAANSSKVETTNTTRRKAGGTASLGDTNNNMRATANMLDVQSDKTTRQFLRVDTNKVFPPPENQPVETFSPINPLLSPGSPGSPSPTSPGYIASPLSPNVAIGGNANQLQASFKSPNIPVVPLLNGDNENDDGGENVDGLGRLEDTENSVRRLSADPDRLPRYPNYGVSVDWFALGVILHQFYCLGRMPFTRGPKRSHRTLLRNMVLGKVRWSESALQCAERNRNELHRRLKEPGRAEKPIVGLTYEAQDLVHKLLHHDPEARLGCGTRGVREIMEHPFFDGIDWDKLEKRHIVPPFIPSSTTVNAEFQPNDYDGGEPTKKEKRKSVMLTDEHHRASFKALEYVRSETLFEELVGCQVDFEANHADNGRQSQVACCIM